MNTEHITKR